MEKNQARKPATFGWFGMFLLLLTGLQFPEVQARSLAVAEAPPAPEMVDIGALRERAQTYLHTEVSGWPAAEVRYEVHVDAPDPRLRLVDCGDALELSPPPQGFAPGRVAIRAGCPGEAAWSIYLTGRIEARREVLVTTRPMGRGQLITAADVMPMEQDLDQLSQGYFTDPAQLIGKVVRRPIPGNRVVETRAVALPRLVRRGEVVQIVAENNSVRVQMTGVALSDGALGDRIQVRNRQSGRVVTAVVNGTGQVDVPL